MTGPSGQAGYIPPDLLLRAYSTGVFPMAEDASDEEVFWVRPRLRGIIPLDGFHAGRSLRKLVRQERFEITFDRDFDAVIDGCAKARDERPTTWINSAIRKACGELYKRGHCHSVEARRDGRLAGGLYGISLGAAFFGESMFALETGASKVCLYHLVERLRAQGFTLLDTQFTTDHLKTFGAIDVPRKDYETLLADAISREANFNIPGERTDI